MIEPAAGGVAIVTGPHTHNFTSVIREFKESEALIEVQDRTGLRNAFSILIDVTDLRTTLGNNALVVIGSNKNVADRTVKLLRRITDS